mmetsp:Transcript_10003/g.26070  ORF Transcript_10003/g.26070 Transcript_10003/m.26070 type:complete len:225 (+) Transcript_10003:1-675(+)
MAAAPRRWRGGLGGPRPRRGSRRGVRPAWLESGAPRRRSAATRAAARAPPPTLARRRPADPTGGPRWRRGSAGPAQACRRHPATRRRRCCRHPRPGARADISAAAVAAHPAPTSHSVFHLPPQLPFPRQQARRHSATRVATTITSAVAVVPGAMHGPWGCHGAGEPLLWRPHQAPRPRLLSTGSADREGCRSSRNHNTSTAPNSAGHRSTSRAPILPEARQKLR